MKKSNSIKSVFFVSSLAMLFFVDNGLCAQSANQGYFELPRPKDFDIRNKNGFDTTVTIDVKSDISLQYILNSFNFCPTINRVEDGKLSVLTAVNADGIPNVKNLPDLKQYNGTSAYRLRQIIQKMLTTYGIKLDNGGLSTFEKQLVKDCYTEKHSAPLVLIDPIIGNTKKSTNLLKQIFTYPLKIVQTVVSLGNNQTKTTKLGNFYVTIDRSSNRKFGMFGKTNPVAKISFAFVQDGNETPFVYRAHSSQDIEKNYNTYMKDSLLSNNSSELLNGFKFAFGNVDQVTDRQTNCGSKSYTPKYLDFQGMYNVNLGTEIFKRLTNATFNSELVYCYHQELSTKGAHIVGFYIMKNVIKGAHEFKKAFDKVPDTEFHFRSASTDGGLEFDSHSKITWKAHASNFSPWLSEKSTIKESGSSRNGKISCYFMLIDNDTYNKYIAPDVQKIQNAEQSSVQNENKSSSGVKWSLFKRSK